MVLLLGKGAGTCGFNNINVKQETNDYLSVEAFNSAQCLFKFHCRRISEMLSVFD